MKNTAALPDPGMDARNLPYAQFQPRGSLGFMAESLAHDLNNVFAPIMTSMEVLQLKIKDDSLRELLILIQRQAQQGSHLVQQILSFANGVESSHACIQPQRDRKSVV